MGKSHTYATHNLTIPLVFMIFSPHFHYTFKIRQIIRNEIKNGIKNNIYNNL
jgi:hypothetical protein